MTLNNDITLSPDCLVRLINNIPHEVCLLSERKIIYRNTRFAESIDPTEIISKLGRIEFDSAEKVILHNGVFNVRTMKLDDNYTLAILAKVKDIKLSVDPLTGLLNRECFDVLFANVLEDSKLNTNILSVLFIDLDGFKGVNDVYGHEKGDVVLKVTAERLSKSIRANDLCFRLGGDEFVVLLKDVKDRLHPCLVGRRIIHAVSEPIVLDESHSAKIGASIGIASYPFDGNSADELLKNSDEAMYRAKKLGKNNYQLYGQ